MALRKINAILSLIAMYLIMDHAIFHAVWMLSRGAIEKPQNPMSRVLVCVMVVHAVISIVLAVLGHKGAPKRKTKSYPKLNAATSIQRTSGMLLILFSALHVLGTVGVLTPPQPVHAVLPPLFFAIALMHVAVSGSKAFITLGVGGARFIRGIDIAIKALCLLTLIADIVGFYLYAF